MANVIGLHGLSLASGNNKLVAAYGNGFVDASNGAGFGIPLSSTNNVEFEAFLQSLFFQNYIDTPLTFNGTVWSRQHVAKVPLARYIKMWNQAMYLGYIKLGQGPVEYPSRIWYCNLPVNDTIQWGYETGSNLVTISGSPHIVSANSGFKTYGLKRGQPFFITTGVDAGQYTIDTVISDSHILLTQNMTASASGVSFWAGGNFFDIARDDGDFLTYLGTNNSLFTAYKRDSLWRYDGASAIQILDAVGTTSGRSVINLHELSIHFHGSSGTVTGFYAYDGRTSVNISAPIQKHIDGINGNMYTGIIAWRENDLYRAYVGDIINTNYGINIPKAVCTYDYNSRVWSVDPIADAITVSADLRQLGTRQTYLGTSDSQILLTPSGNSFNGSPIPWRFDTNAIFPLGTEKLCKFLRVEILSENASGITMKYKLHLAPYETDTNYSGVGQIDHEKTILFIPDAWNQSSGIQLQFLGISAQEPTPLIKKITIYYELVPKTPY